MEINNFLKAKHEMEDELAIAIDHIIHKFQNLTGFTPSRISVDILDATLVGSPRKEYVVGKVHTTIDLE
jgi:hypothetical protein